LAIATSGLNPGAFSAFTGFVPSVAAVFSFGEKISVPLHPADNKSRQKQPYDTFPKVIKRH